MKGLLRLWWVSLTVSWNRRGEPMTHPPLLPLSASSQEEIGACLAQENLHITFPHLTPGEEDLGSASRSPSQNRSITENGGNPAG